GSNMNADRPFGPYRAMLAISTFFAAGLAGRNSRSGSLADATRLRLRLGFAASGRPLRLPPFAVVRRMLDWRMFRYGFHGTHEAIPSVRAEFDIVGRPRLISLHTCHDNTSGRPLQPPRRSAILEATTPI